MGRGTLQTQKGEAWSRTIYILGGLLIPLKRHMGQLVQFPKNMEFRTKAQTILQKDPLVKILVLGLPPNHFISQ